MDSECGFTDSLFSAQVDAGINMSSQECKISGVLHAKTMDHQMSLDHAPCNELDIMESPSAG